MKQKATEQTIKEADFAEQIDQLMDYTGVRMQEAIRILCKRQKGKRQLIKTQ